MAERRRESQKTTELAGAQRVTRGVEVAERSAASVARGALQISRSLMSGPTHPGSVLALQRTVGNRSTTALLQRRPLAVQRDLEEGIDKSGSVLDTSAGQIGQWGGLGGGLGTAGSNSGAAYQYGNTSSPGAQAGSSGAIIGGATGLWSTVSSSRQAETARRKKNEEEEAGRGGEATHRDASRTQKTQSTNAVQSGVNIGSNVMTATSGFSQVAANAGSTSAFAGMNNLLGGIGGIIALPVQALSTLRTMRKAWKQWGRVKKLREDLADPNADLKTQSKKLQMQEESLEAFQSLHDDADSDLQELKTEFGINFPARPSSRKQPEQYALYVSERQRVRDAEEIVNQFKRLIQQGQEEKTRIAAAKAAAEQAVREAHDRAQNKQETPEDIRAYAMRKNSSGFFKKIVATVGGVLGIGGGIAATIASFAAIGATAVVGTAVIATPVGWALCGAAALIGLAMGGYAFWKWASKRYERAREAGKSKFASFLHSINPFSKQIGQSTRERLADRLYNFALNGADRENQTKAKETISALGLDWDRLNMADPQHKEASIKLIHQKMAS